MVRQEVLEGGEIMQLGFGQKLRCMMFVRNIGTKDLAKKAYLPEEAISLVARGLFVATPELEHKLRVLLDWPKSSDEHLSLVYFGKYADETPAEVEAPVTKPMTTPTIIKPSVILKKKLGRPRKVSQEPEDDKIEDDGEIIELDEVRGSVVG